MSTILQKLVALQSVHEKVPVVLALLSSKTCVKASMHKRLEGAASCRFGQQLKGNSGLASKVWDSKRDDIQQRVSYKCFHVFSSHFRLLTAVCATQILPTAG